MALSDLVKKSGQISDSQTEAETPPANNQKPAKRTMSEEDKAFWGTYQLTFRDPYSGKSITDTFRGCTRWGDVLNRMEREGAISFPRCYLKFPVPNLNIREGKLLYNIPGLHSGMTIDVDVYQAADEQLRNNPNFRKSYPLVFYRMVDNVCIQKIEFLCYGFELPKDVIRRMQHDNCLSFHSTYDMLYWPDTLGNVNAVGSFQMAQPAYLCAFDPEPGRVFILQEHKPAPSVEDNFPMSVMYGCPSAAMPEQEALANNRSVDILRFD